MVLRGPAVVPGALPRNVTLRPAAAARGERGDTQHLRTGTTSQDTDNLETYIRFSSLSFSPSLTLLLQLFFKVVPGFSRDILSSINPNLDDKHVRISNRRN